ncbi:Uncharacterised protein [uncultured archaeon]|nr:Uncharacterised protein [uncultured archaeon]
MYSYPNPVDLVTPDSWLASGVFLHAFILVSTFVLSIYAVRSLIKNGEKISKNWRVLAIAFGLISVMPVIDLFTHASVLQTETFWRHLELFIALVTFNYIHRFIVTVNNAEPDGMKTHVSVLIGVFLFSVIFSELERLIQGVNPELMAVVYAILFVAVVWTLYTLLRIVSKATRAEGAFSMRAFTISIIPMLSVALFLFSAAMLVSEAVDDLAPQLSVQPILLVVSASLNVFYLGLATVLIGFAYTGSEVMKFSTPETIFGKRPKAPPIKDVRYAPIP